MHFDHAFGFAFYLAIAGSQDLGDFFVLQMVKDPTEFDVLVMPNLYGDILR